MPIKSSASVFLISTLLAACSTASANKAEMPNVDTFAAFISVAEKAAATSHEYLTLPAASFAGRDYAVKSGRATKGGYMAYSFSESPCVTDALASAEIIKHGYVKVMKSIDPHGARRNDEGPANHAFHELYRYGEQNGARSINLDYSTVDSKVCLRTMFIDFAK